MKLIFGLLILSVSVPAFGHESGDEADEIPPQDILLAKEFPATAKTAALKVLVHKAGHLVDRPYVVEISEMCPVAGSAKDAPRVIDTISVCDVAKNTVEVDPASSSVSVQVREPSSAGVCGIKAKRVTMRLQSHCKDD